ncbi:MAG: bacteriohopanetetrol glucosamine biosynthesis glycosyltransferase HpnI [Edaphobacter sp.]|uniref:bacteriohopanetetrol glucosamine biosynthesis glycosyltransferase HpnI n=1 Tax=Edaphobacter sp. TaxID=1934404 RepID=UPI002385F9C5|nr:bacteriohopanetetrol glucosamine biosynthesis glycosyltransferase HpnI [Edaphobacter sp.]MDE1176713.1 bacteriohopanetetrol glucosamine biosynthesis glycosyltransferase HpnI [Edaphobacter sp.]
MLATWMEGATALMAVAGIVYMALALWGARNFARSIRRQTADPFAPGVTILKPVKGVDQRMYAGFVSHCQQQYAGSYEIVFGVSSMDDPAVAEIHRLIAEFPSVAIRLVHCTEVLGTSGKVSNLVQMLRHASYEHVLINDSDILVSPRYLTRVMQGFVTPGAKPVGMVTAPYIGHTGERPGLWSRLEALGISTDFIAGVLTARQLEGGIHFGLGSTLAMSRTALTAAGGLEPLVEALADDYEMGARISAAGFRVELSSEVVETTVPAYSFRGFAEHQLRWSRTTRDSRKLGYLGLGITYCVPWALAACIASGFSLEGFSLLAIALLARVAVALTVGVGILGDGQVLRDLWLLPVRDLFGLLFWAWSYAGDTIVWRGERFHLRDGRLYR